jgi:hypothetical protein
MELKILSTIKENKNLKYLFVYCNKKIVYSLQL